jgi:signal transduction histidine kinase
MDAEDLRGEADQLRASRARVVAAADEERRRVERNLHDGVQQHLVALAVNLQLVRQLAESDPTAMGALLDEMAADVRDALESVRALAQTVYPPLLLDRGLGDALRAALRESGSAVHLEVTATGRYGAETEAAVYFACIEALAPGATIRVWETEGALHFDIAGEGVGLEARSTAADRAGVLGGSVEPAAGRISGRVPIRR